MAGVSQLSSDPQMAELVLEKLQGLGEPRVRRMFSEYCIYLNDKPVGFLVNNHLLVKTNEEMRKSRPEMPTQKLFEKAINPMWVIEDPDDTRKVRDLYKMAFDWLPAKKAKRSLETQTRKRIKRGEGKSSPRNQPPALKRTRKKL